jgi:hypothetical protein
LTEDSSGEMSKHRQKMHLKNAVLLAKFVYCSTAPHTPIIEYDFGARKAKSEVRYPLPSRI